MVIHPWFNPILAIVVGILILIFPALLNLIVALYLIITGAMGLIGKAP